MLDLMNRRVISLNHEGNVPPNGHPYHHCGEGGGWVGGMLGGETKGRGEMESDSAF